MNAIHVTADATERRIDKQPDPRYRVLLGLMMRHMRVPLFSEHLRTMHPASTNAALRGRREAFDDYEGGRMNGGNSKNDQVLRENEALRRQVAALEADARRCKTTLYSIGDAVISTNADGSVVQMNHVAETLTGWSEVEAKGRPTAEVFKIVNEETRAEVESPVARVLREGVVVGLANHTLLVAKDGTVRPIADSGAPIRDDKGEISGVVLVFRDQTEERAAQKAVEQSEARFRAVFEGSPLSESMTEIGGRVNVNRAFCDLLGYTKEELRGGTWQTLTHPEDVEASASIIKSLLAGDIADAHYEKRYLHKNGHVIWADVTTALARDTRGEPLFFITTVTDITERKRTEQQIARLNAELEAKVAERTSQLNDEMELIQKIIRSSPVGIFACRAEGPCVLANPAVARISGAPLEKMLQLNFHQLEAWKKNGLFDAAQAALATGADQHAEVHVTTTFGREVWLSYTFATFERAGAPHFLMVVDDITERKRAEIALHEHAAQLLESNKELEAFSYSVSHDLRAPLRAIDGFTRILADEYAPDLNTEGKRLCTVVRENTAKMSRLIDDLLEFSRLGRAEMQPSRIDMGAMANSIFHELTTPESRSRIDFQVGSLPTAIGDPSLMRQVWLNVLGNAVKFSSKRERAIIQVSGASKEGESFYVVQDNGAGFDMQYVHKLFGVFQRLHSTKEFEGTGVGLALVQRVIRRHAGRVWAQGEPDCGATFTFALPRKAS
jgi:PAS domain S-box-containing protein